MEGRVFRVQDIWELSMTLLVILREGKTWMDFIHMGVDVRQFCSSAAQTYKNYKKIGNIVGEKQAKEWWFKNITGLRPLGRASTAKKWHNTL